MGRGIHTGQLARLLVTNTRVWVAESGILLEDRYVLGFIMQYTESRQWFPGGLIRLFIFRDIKPNLLHANRPNPWLLVVDNGLLPSPVLPDLNGPSLSDPSCGHLAAVVAAAAQFTVSAPRARVHPAAVEVNAHRTPFFGPEWRRSRRRMSAWDTLQDRLAANACRKVSVLTIGVGGVRCPLLRPVRASGCGIRG